MRRRSPGLSFAVLLLALPQAMPVRAFVQDPARPAEAQGPESDFGRLASRLAQQRLGGGEESEQLQEQALGILDGLVLRALNVPGDPNLEALNQRLAGLIMQQTPVGEDYRVVRLAGTPPVYALVANFSLGGPSAVRLYRGIAGRHTLAARVDRFAQKDFFDEYLELVPIAAQVPLFITVSGRTDELQTGAFVLWRFDGDRVMAIWATDILQESNYENRSDGFRLTYCAETDEDNPRVCRRMTRDRYHWNGAAWKRVEQTPLPVPKR